MRAKFIKTGYTTEELNGFINNEIEIPGIIDLCWAYIESDTIEELIINRSRLIARLRAKEKAYIVDIWQPKEPRVIFCYTKLLANLGCVATQRSESYHVPIKKVINGQLSLEESGLVISEKILSILTKLSIDEDRALIDADLALDATAFKLLIGAVSIEVIRLIEKKWLSICDITDNSATNIDLGLY